MGGACRRIEGTPVVYLSQSLVIDLFTLLIFAVSVASFWITVSSWISGFASGLNLIILIRSSKVRGWSFGGIGFGWMPWGDFGVLGPCSSGGVWIDWGVFWALGPCSSGGVGVGDVEMEGTSPPCVAVAAVSSGVFFACKVADSGVFFVLVGSVAYGVEDLHRVNVG